MRMTRMRTSDSNDKCNDKDNNNEDNNNDDKNNDDKNNDAG